MVSTKTFKILSVVDGSGWGGTKFQVYYLARELSKKGLDVHMALNFDYHDMVEKLKPWGVTFHFFEKSGKLRRFNISNYYRLWKIIKEGNFEFIIVNSPHALDYVSVVYRFLNRKPKIIIVKRNARASNFLSLKFKYSIGDVIVCVSEKVKEIMLKSGIPEEKLKVIRSGIDLERFYPRAHEKEQIRKELGIPTDAFVFINVANWHPSMKAQDLIIKAFSELNLKDCFFVMVGYKTDTEGKALAKSLGVEDRFLGLGFREDVERVLACADCFVLFSFYEGFPNALIQAMAEGLVCISSAISGAVEVIQDGVTGFLVEPGNVKNLKETMEKVYFMYPEQREKIGTRAMNIAKEFSVENNARQYVELFESLVRN